MNTSEPSTAVALEDLRTIKGLVAERPDLLTEQTVRYQMRHRDTNGLGSALVPVGKQLLISLPLYEKWLGSRAGKA